LFFCFKKNQALAAASYRRPTALWKYHGGRRQPLASVAAEDSPGGAAVGAERGAGVAGADAVGAVHDSVARQAEPGGIGAAVDRRRRRRGSAVIAGHRLGAGVTAVRPSSRSYEKK
jgi:hypothetical protein